MTRSVVIEAPGIVRLAQTGDPLVQMGDALVRVMNATICGSDLKIVDGTMEGLEYPLVPGHEWVGEVVEVGRANRHFLHKVVVSDLLEHCGGCTFCNRQQPNLCGHLVEPGLTRPGAFAEFVAVRASNLIALPEEVSRREAALIEPLAVALYALRRVPVSAGETVAIFGGGGVGQLIARACAFRQAGRIGLIDPHPFRKAVATSYVGAETFEPGPHLVDRWRARGLPLPQVVFEASGDPHAFTDAMDLCEQGGRIGVVGYAGRQQTTVEPAKLMTKLLSIHGVLSPTGTWHEAIDLVRSSAISIDGLITREFPLTAIQEAFEFARSHKNDTIRVGVVPQ